MKSKAKVNIISGFLGAGKTTMVLNILKELGSTEKIAVLVNEFGQLGLDGEVIGRETSEVVELAQGCICCSIQGDFVRAVEKIITTFNPVRIIVEPTGLATPGQIVTAFRDPLIRDQVDLQGIITVIDASNFFSGLIAMKDLFTGQIRLASIAVVNKTDRVRPGELNWLEELIRKINPELKLFFTKECKLDFAPLLDVPGPAPEMLAGEEKFIADVHFQTFSWHRPGVLSKAALGEFMEALGKGTFGSVVRAKGHFVLADGCLKIDWVHEQVSVRETTCRENKLSIIGRDLNKEQLAKALDLCIGLG